jgi:hypothetical protein
MFGMNFTQDMGVRLAVLNVAAVRGIRIFHEQE